MFEHGIEFYYYKGGYFLMHMSSSSSSKHEVISKHEAIDLDGSSEESSFDYSSSDS